MMAQVMMKQGVGCGVGRTVSSPSSCARMPSIMAMVPPLRWLAAAYARSLPSCLAAAHPLYART